VWELDLQVWRGPAAAPPIILKWLEADIHCGKGKYSKTAEYVSSTNNTSNR
jgi:hypothetical protein